MVAVRKKPYPTAIDFIKFRMENMNLSRADLVPYLGGKNRVSEVLNGRRGLSIGMIRRLHTYLGVPLEVLIYDGKAPLDYPLFNVEAIDVKSE